MFLSLTLRQRLLATIVLSGGVFLIAGLLFTLNHRSNLANEAIDRRGENLQTILNERIATKKEFGLGLAVMLANNQSIQEFIYTDNREQAAHTLNGIINYFAENTNYRGLRVQIHTADGHSWLRSWKPEHYGDNLLFRASIIKMMEEKRPFTNSDDIGRAGFAIRGLAPIFHNGEYLGSIEVLQGVGSVSREFESDNQVYIMLLNKSIVNQSPEAAKNQSIGNHLLANDNWFNQRAKDFATAEL
ncbi:cache domain-containing protein [Pseudomonas sp. C27(2019)]|uniref:cache domain-containing protein n=1 Tax=Pseudomonas sp. C27(2019) TaxID=2604941 RepID=UPI0015B5D99D|nr:cache domain-containing protein [Pseudomonas sp. C27(2019)]